MNLERNSDDKSPIYLLSMSIFFLLTIWNVLNINISFLLILNKYFCLSMKRHRIPIITLNYLIPNTTIGISRWKKVNN